MHDWVLVTVWSGRISARRTRCSPAPCARNAPDSAYMHVWPCIWPESRRSACSAVALSERLNEAAMHPSRAIGLGLGSSSKIQSMQGDVQCAAVCKVGQLQRFPPAIFHIQEILSTWVERRKVPSHLCLLYWADQTGHRLGSPVSLSVEQQLRVVVVVDVSFFSETGDRPSLSLQNWIDNVQVAAVSQCVVRLVKRTPLPPETSDRETEARFSRFVLCTRKTLARCPLIWRTPWPRWIGSLTFEWDKPCRQTSPAQPPGRGEEEEDREVPAMGVRALVVRRAHRRSTPMRRWVARKRASSRSRTRNRRSRTRTWSLSQ